MLKWSILNRCGKILSWGGQKLIDDQSIRSEFLRDLHSESFEVDECLDTRQPAEGVPQGTTGIVIHKLYRSGILSVTVLGYGGEEMHQWKEHPFSLGGVAGYIRRGSKTVVISQLKRTPRVQTNLAGMNGMIATSLSAGIGDDGLAQQQPISAHVPNTHRITYQLPFAGMGYGVPEGANMDETTFSQLSQSGYI